MQEIKTGSHVRKIKGFRFIGTVLCVYWVPNHDDASGEYYAVVMLDSNNASDGLQHIYKLDQLEVFD